MVGEISNLHRARSGHSYFTLKDDEAQIRAALFRGVAQRLPFDPEDGLEVVVFGDLTLYPSRGDLQIVVRSLEPRGQGALQLAFEQLRARLEAEGLFAPELKRPLPEFPRRVGVVTSPTGAAIRDVIQVTGQCFPSIPLLVAPTRVQGEGAEEEIAAALELVAGRGVDVILLVRGGGSLEDLFAFNTERVARAIRACPVPGGERRRTRGRRDHLRSGGGRARAHALRRSGTGPAGPRRATRPGWIETAVGCGRPPSASLDRAARRLGRSRESLRAHAPSARLLADRVRLEAAVERPAAGDRGPSRQERRPFRRRLRPPRRPLAPGRALPGLRHRVPGAGGGDRASGAGGEPRGCPSAEGRRGGDRGHGECRPRAAETDGSPQFRRIFSTSPV